MIEPEQAPTRPAHAAGRARRRRLRLRGYRSPRTPADHAGRDALVPGGGCLQAVGLRHAAEGSPRPCPGGASRHSRDRDWRSLSQRSRRSGVAPRPESHRSPGADPSRQRLHQTGMRALQEVGRRGDRDRSTRGLLHAGGGRGTAHRAWRPRRVRHARAGRRGHRPARRAQPSDGREVRGRTARVADSATDHAGDTASDTGRPTGHRPGHGTHREQAGRPRARPAGTRPRILRRSRPRSPCWPPGGSGCR